MWLPFLDDGRARADSASSLQAAVAEPLADADSLLIPGFPLVQADHLAVTRALLTERAGLPRLGLYIEQPYATWEGLSKRSRSPAAWWSARHPGAPTELANSLDSEVRWVCPSTSPSDWARKLRAARSYRSQLARLRRWPLLRISAYEAMRGGEGIAWVSR